MKKLFFLLVLLFPLMAGAQIIDYKYGAPKPVESFRTSALNYYPYEANDAIWLVYAVANSGTNIFLQVGSTNNVILISGATAGQTNILVLPNATNSIGAVFNIVNCGSLTTILSNAVTGSFNNLTNPPSSGSSAPSTFQLQSNRVVKVFSPFGTNWFVLDLRGNVP